MKILRTAMMRCIVAIALAFVCTSVVEAADVTMVSGQVTWVSPDAVEVAGRRGMISSRTSITSDGRSVSVSSIQVGMPAELEIDPAGQALELRVKGAVE